MSRLKVWLYGAGAFIAATAASALGFVIAITGPPNAYEVEELATILTESPEGDVAAAPEMAERAPDFPDFAPNGVIVVRASQPAPEPRAAEPVRVQAAAERVRAAPPQRQPAREPAVERAPTRSAREAEPASRTVRANARRSAPTTVRADRTTSVSQNRSREADAPRETREWREPAPQRYEAGYADEPEVYAEERDNRSWYGSRAYREELAAQRRAERDARRRYRDGW